MTQIPFPLFHGTSTLFLQGIATQGLAGFNPINELGVISFAEELLPLIESNIIGEEWSQKKISFKKMATQDNVNSNFQHGDTYLSPAKNTAIRYAINKKYGSEILSYCLDFLQELLNRKVPGVADNLYNKYPHIFSFLDISCSPILVRVDAAHAENLRGEHGEDPLHNLLRISEALKSGHSLSEMQQINFRTSVPINTSHLDFWLINVQKWHPFTPTFTLHKIEHNSDSAA